MRNGWRIAMVVGLGVTAFGALYILQDRVFAQTSPAAVQQASKFIPHPGGRDRWWVVLTDAAAGPQGHRPAQQISRSF
jgi:hypothetical protein